VSPASPDPATQVGTAFDAGERSTRLRVPLIWGVVFGFLQAAAPLGLWWIRPATVYAISLVLIAAVYIGFAVADGRRNVIAVEISVATVFVLVGAVAVTGSLWVAVAGLVGHGAKDLWQHRTGFVNNTRWWPPFCAHRRLGRRSNRGHCDNGRRRLRLTRPAIMPSRAAIRARRPQTRPSPANSPARAADRPSHHRYVGLAADSASGPAGA